MLRLFVPLIFGSLLLAGCQTTQSTLTRTTLAGQSLRLDFVGSYNPDCTPIGTATIRIMRPPTSGQVNISKGNGYTSFASANQRSQCNLTARPGTIVTYVPRPGFVGEDSFDAELIFGTGQVITKTYRVTVR